MSTADRRIQNLARKVGKVYDRHHRMVATGRMTVWELMKWKFPSAPKDALQEAITIAIADDTSEGEPNPRLLKMIANEFIAEGRRQ